ncbi:hypothetical protein [Streptomyces sp. NPDC002851]
MNSLTPPTRPSPPSLDRRRRPAGPSRTVRGLSLTAALLLIPLAVAAGSDDFRAALDFTSGVLCLVALTCSVVWGLVASDRLFLGARQRLLAQAVHRGTAVAAVGFLLLHGTIKLNLDHVAPVDALVPFAHGVVGTAGLIGFGTLAGLLLLTVAVTGALRSSFASPARVAGRWRALHTLAYPAWCSALVHGLYAGREPAAWVVVLYCLCLAAVAGALALRAAPEPVKRKVSRRILALLSPDGRTSRTPEEEPPARRDSAPLPGMDGSAAHHTTTVVPPRPSERPFTPPMPRLYEAEAPSSAASRHPWDTETGTTTDTAAAPGPVPPPGTGATTDTAPSAGLPTGETATPTGLSAAYRAVSAPAPRPGPVPLPHPPAGPAAPRSHPAGSGTPHWPAPSPPPPAEATPSTYETSGTVPRPRPASGPAHARTSHARAPYTPDRPSAHPAYDDGPVTEPLPRPGHEREREREPGYEPGHRPGRAPTPAPGADCRPPVTGEPWDAPSSTGGHR